MKSHWQVQNRWPGPWNRDMSCDPLTPSPTVASYAMPRKANKGSVLPGFRDTAPRLCSSFRNLVPCVPTRSILQLYMWERRGASQLLQVRPLKANLWQELKRDHSTSLSLLRGWSLAISDPLSTRRSQRCLANHWRRQSLHLRFTMRNHHSSHGIQIRMYMTIVYKESPGTWRVLENLIRRSTTAELLHDDTGENQMPWNTPCISGVGRKVTPRHPAQASSGILCFSFSLRERCPLWEPRLCIFPADHQRTAGKSVLDFLVLERPVARSGVPHSRGASKLHHRLTFT